MFNIFRSGCFRFLITSSLLINPLLFAFSKKVNAQNIKLTCETKNHIKDWGNDYWEDLQNRIFTVEIDPENNVVILQTNIVYEGKDYSLIWNYLISFYDKEKIVAFEDDMRSDQGGISADSITLDLSKGKVSLSNHMIDERGYAFDLSYGKCFKM